MQAVQSRQTSILTLPETVYGGEVDAVTGDGQETWKILTLDGTERWMDNGSVPSTKQQQWALYGILEPYSAVLGISSHFDNQKNLMNIRLTLYALLLHPSYFTWPQMDLSQQSMI